MDGASRLQGELGLHVPRLHHRRQALHRMIAFYRRHPNAVWWLLAALAVVAAIAILWTTQQHNTERFSRNDRAIVAANIDGCQRANDTRKAIRATIEAAQTSLDDQIASLRATKPEFFPNIPPAQFAQLIRQRVEGLRKVREKTARARRLSRNAPCHKLFPRLTP